MIAADSGVMYGIHDCVTILHPSFLQSLSRLCVCVYGTVTVRLLVLLCGYKYKCHDVHVKTSGVCAYNFTFNLSFCVTLGGSWPKATCMVHPRNGFSYDGWKLKLVKGDKYPIPFHQFMSFVRSPGQVSCY